VALCRGKNSTAERGWWLIPYLFGFPDFDDKQGFFAHAVCAMKIKLQRKFFVKGALLWKQEEYY
jgi:hypothetical protein